MNLFSRVVHNWELSLWPLWFQKHPLDWPENRGKKHYIYVHHIFQQAFLVITFIVKFRLTAKVCMLSHLFPQNIFAVAAAASVRLEFFGPLGKATRCTTTSYIS